jgi:hypothetical protein
LPGIIFTGHHLYRASSLPGIVFTGHRLYRASILVGLNGAMLGTNLTLKEQLLAGAAMALTFIVCYVAGLQAGGHW